MQPSEKITPLHRRARWALSILSTDAREVNGESGGYYARPAAAAAAAPYFKGRW